MSVTEYKTDGSRREFDKHFKRKTKEELIHVLWDAMGNAERSSVELAAPRLYHALAKVWENFDLDEFEDRNGNNFAWLAGEVQAALAQARGETDAT